MERERDSWKQAAFIAHQSGAMARVTKPPTLKKMMAQFDPQKQPTQQEIRQTLEAMGGVTNGN